MEKKYNGIPDIKLMDIFPTKYPNRSYFNYVANNVNIEGFIAVAGMLMPEIIEANGHIFLGENYFNSVARLPPSDVYPKASGH